MDSIIDLHTHSCYSDGEYTPDEIISQAKDINIGTIAITDHDTLLGNKNITDYSINVIPGIELSAKTDHGQMHILGYGIDIYNHDLNEKMEELQQNSITSVLLSIHQVEEDYGLHFKEEDIEKIIHATSNVGRNDLARLLLKYGDVKSIDEAFDNYLTPAYNKIRKNKKGINYKECIELILNAGGIPVLAHPITLKRTDNELYELISKMVKCGLEGIEAYQSKHSIELTKKYLELAKIFNLYVSGGTDYHGEIIKPKVKLGTGIDNNLKIKHLSILDELKRRKC